MKHFLPFIVLLAAACTPTTNTVTKSGNPIFEGSYADPEGVVFGDECWVYPTWSVNYDEQLHFDAFSSKDLVHWTKHERIIDSSRVKWARRAMWAPAAVEKDGKYYLFFAANDVHEGEIINGAQPIDQYVFKDKDGSYYMYYGGWGHCNICRLADDFRSVVPFDDGEMFKEVTPEGYVEGPFMFIHNDKYYFMWSEGGWTGPDYRVAYAIADSPFGPFERRDVILHTDENVATGAGHHSVVYNKRSDKYYIIYHRHPLGYTDGNDRVTCIEQMHFDSEGNILPVKLTFEGVAADRF